MNIDFEYQKTEKTGDFYTDIYDVTPIKFCFVGPRGVGKTSLLASMYQQIKDKQISNVYIDIDTDLGARTNAELANALDAMAGMIEDTDKGSFVEVGGIGGSQEEKEFEFTGDYTVEDTSFIRTSKYKRFRFHFRFVDMPGGWYENGGEEHMEDVKAHLLSSQVSFLAVDTPSLMEGGAPMLRNNKVSAISGWYNSFASDLGAENHTVIMVLSRCEAYWSRKEEMLAAVQQHYGAMINRLQGNGVAVFVTWVKTLGGIEFSHFAKVVDAAGNKISVAKFIRNGDYSPENCATPMQLALKYGLVRAAASIPVGVLAWLGFSVKGLAVEGATNFADLLHDKLDAGKEDTFKQL